MQLQPCATFVNLSNFIVFCDRLLSSVLSNSSPGSFGPYLCTFSTHLLQTQIKCLSTTLCIAGRHLWKSSLKKGNIKQRPDRIYRTSGLFDHHTTEPYTYSKVMCYFTEGCLNKVPSGEVISNVMINVFIVIIIIKPLINHVKYQLRLRLLSKSWPYHHHIFKLQEKDSAHKKESLSYNNRRMFVHATWEREYISLF